MKSYFVSPEIMLESCYPRNKIKILLLKLMVNLERFKSPLGSILLLIQTFQQGRILIILN